MSASLNEPGDGVNPSGVTALADVAQPDMAQPGIAQPDGAESGSVAAPLPLTEAEETLRAIAAGEVDAFVVSDGGKRRVYTVSTADRPYRMFVENMRDGAATVSSLGLILYANRRLAEMLSHPRERIVGTLLAVHIESDVPGGEVDLGQVMIGGSTVEVNLVDMAGKRVPVLCGISPLDVDGEVMSCVTFTDLSAQKAQESEIARLGQVQADRLAELQVAQRELTRQATHDALTGLPNRDLLVDRIDQALSQTLRTGSAIAVLFVDLDRFKQVNDIHGHAVGDIVLRKVGEIISRVVRRGDTVARIGGDEFVVLTRDVDHPVRALELADRLVAELGASEGDTLAIAASIGIATSVGGRGTAEILLNEADVAMYQAKARGGGRAELFDEALGQQIQLRTIARTLLEDALNQRRVVAYYQPIVDLDSGLVAGVEALARIAVRDGTILQPASFIAVAEDTGLVVPLGGQVLEAACRDSRHWSHPGSRRVPLTVAVNIAAKQFESGSLVNLIVATLDTTGTPASSLHLELTETAIIDLRPEILLQLCQLRDLGVEVGLDDFGTGYASLTHLRRLPLSFVKIDQTFVQGIGVDRDDEGIVAAVIDLAANLGLRSIAEGVETEPQLARLRELGCIQAQGYLFARPLPASAVPSILSHPAW